ncbi:hypothetical protein CEXT_808921 [Caerostris extrusa]|uniref:Uncharacterized protein n=1 Tax=Caerostris extrusa TaxID=172846 RepID=A0AAV4VNX7_CAEEX|nr:hypothetical protein CEXT_808921 [Caerostris extrusa]
MPTPFARVDKSDEKRNISQRRNKMIVAFALFPGPVELTTPLSSVIRSRQFFTSSDSFNSVGGLPYQSPDQARKENFYYSYFYEFS